MILEISKGRLKGFATYGMRFTRDRSEALRFDSLETIAKVAHRWAYIGKGRDTIPTGWKVRYLQA